MKKSVIILLVALSLIYTSCEKIDGEGPVVTETRNVSNFKSISVSIPGTVNYKIDPVYKVEISAQQNILDVLQTSLVGDELVLKVKNGVSIKDHENIVVTISAPYANSINLSGSAEFTVLGTLTATDCAVRISGSGNINIPQIAVSNKLNATISGSGDIHISAGTAKEEDLRISGSGNIDFANVAADKATTQISGSGDMWVNLSQQLNATISGSGSVHYRGQPLISTQISGSGKVVPF